MKNVISGIVISMFLVSLGHASFMYTEIDPICSISGTTHTSFPGEISDTSSWSIPVAHDGECDDITELSQDEKDRVYDIMNTLFIEKEYYGALYTADSDSTSKNLNVSGQNFVNKKFFPAIQSYLKKERNKTHPNTKAIAILNYAVKMIGYDYYIQKS